VEVDFKILVLEDSFVPPLLLEVAKLPNVEVVFRKNYSSDLCGYYHYLSRQDLGPYDFFFLLNFGARGPYVRPGRNPLFYIHRYLNLFKSNVAVAGASISCEEDVHVQTWFIVLNKMSLNVALGLWKACPTVWREVVIQGEIGLSATIRKMGYRIASPVEEFNPYYNGKCAFKRNPGLKEQKLFEQIFVKYGGQMAREYLLDYKTLVEVVKHGGMLGMESERSENEQVQYLKDHIINRSCKDARIMYLKQYPGIRKAGVDPWEHYLNFGKKEARKWPGRRCDDDQDGQEL
jgi:hypothetical protein